MAKSWLFTKQAKVLYAAAVVVNTLAVALLACLATCCYFAMFVDLRNRSVTTGDAVDGSIGSGPPPPPPSFLASFLRCKHAVRNNVGSKK